MQAVVAWSRLRRDVICESDMRRATAALPGGAAAAREGPGRIEKESKERARKKLLSLPTSGPAIAPAPTTMQMTPRSPEEADNNPCGHRGPHAEARDGEG